MRLDCFSKDRPHGRFIGPCLTNRGPCSVQIISWVILDLLSAGAPFGNLVTVTEASACFDWPMVHFVKQHPEKGCDAYRWSQPRAVPRHSGRPYPPHAPPQKHKGSCPNFLLLVHCFQRRVSNNQSCHELINIPLWLQVARNHAPWLDLPA